MPTIDIKLARRDPGSVFATPEDLLKEPTLSKTDKEDLLKRWKFDAARILDSGSEGLGVNKDSDLLRRITLALEVLENDS